MLRVRGVQGSDRADPHEKEGEQRRKCSWEPPDSLHHVLQLPLGWAGGQWGLARWAEEQQLEAPPD